MNTPTKRAIDRVFGSKAVIPDASFADMQGRVQAQARQMAERADELLDEHKRVLTELDQCRQLLDIADHTAAHYKAEYERTDAERIKYMRFAQSLVTRLDVLIEQAVGAKQIATDFALREQVKPEPAPLSESEEKALGSLVARLAPATL